MFPGFATPPGTEDLAAQNPELDYLPLGRTGLKTSAVGFGGYRISLAVPQHAAALNRALQCGVNLIDTSTNYADGDSERLVGQVLGKGTQANEVRRDQVIVVSKVGYLQGRNYARSQERKAQGNAFAELVEYGEGLEHCIHPDFIADQLDRSLRRLNLETIDICLLHNPEYYLTWARKQGRDLQTGRQEYYRRIENAFAHLEREVARGRIRWYGVSSNTFPDPAEGAEFTSLTEILEAAARVSQEHHMGIIELPLNLLENGAVLQANQPDGQSVLELAHARQIGVLINRPLNAFAGQRLLRLSEVPDSGDYSTPEILQAINALSKSEKRFQQKFLLQLGVPGPLTQRINAQLGVADQLKHYWRNFSTFERWRHVQDNFFLPRVQGALLYLRQHESTQQDLALWIDDHTCRLKKALMAVGSQYITGARRQVTSLRRKVRSADPQWAEAETLSQMAIRAVRSTHGVSCVLVGMRQSSYVADILAELRRPIQTLDRKTSWRRMAEMSATD